MIISIVAAVSENGVIGINNRLPWRLHDDMVHFRKLTMGHYILMGRNTYESIGRPLPGRVNIVLTSRKTFHPEGVLVKNSLEDAFHYAETNDQNEIFIIGGNYLYRESLPYAGKLYYTKVLDNIEGDTYFPALNWEEWKTLSVIEYSGGEKNDHSFRIIEMLRLSGGRKY